MYSIWLWLYLKLSLNTLCPIWCMYVDNRYFYCYKPAEISLCLFIRSSVIVTCFTMDSILTPQSSHWPAIRNRADSFHSRYNEPRHLWVCRRKELGEWRDLRGRTVCPSHVQGNRGCGAHGATPTCTAILALPQKQHGPCLRIRFNHRSDRTQEQSCRVFSLRSQNSSVCLSWASSAWFSAHVGLVQPQAPRTERSDFFSGKLAPQPRVARVHTLSHPLSHPLSIKK